MKRFLPFLMLFFALYVTSDSLAQAKRYTLFEHFTQASCGPCAQQNPAFQEIYDNNKANVHHVAYHTVWPGVDPMNTLNPTEVADMVTYYSVSGVPDMIHDGTSIGSPVAVSQNLIDKVNSSPVRIEVQESMEGDSVMKGQIRIVTVGSKPAGTFLMRVIATEKDVNYTTPPGSNGEKYFPNVFRQFVLSGSGGLIVNLPDSGEMVEVAYSYDIQAEWNPQEMYTLVYLQNESTKEVLNSGSSNDPVYNLVNLDEKKFKDAQSGVISFEGNIFSSDTNDVELVMSDSDAPDGWNATWTIAGNEVSDGDTVTLLSGDAAVSLTVDPDTISGVASFSMIIRTPGTTDEQRLTYFVINNITDLVVVSDNSPSGGANVDFGAPYIRGLEQASTEQKGSMGHTFLADADEADALTGVENIYYSIGWSFPALTDEVTNALINHLDKGGNLMIAGQDVGWDIMSMHSASNGTPLQRTFYTDYLKADYIDDGSSANSAFISNPDDPIYGDIANTTVAPVYTSTNTYPDQIDPIGDDAHSIFSYTTTKSAGIRVEREGYKVVYLGIGLEQVADTEIADQIFTTTHDWFHGLLSGVDIVDADGATLGNAYPNPGIDRVNIDWGHGLKGDVELILSDMTGRAVNRLKVDSGMDVIELNISGLSPGVYYYQVSNGKKTTTAKKLVKS